MHLHEAPTETILQVGSFFHAAFMPAFVNARVPVLALLHYQPLVLKPHPLFGCSDTPIQSLAPTARLVMQCVASLA